MRRATVFVILALLLFLVSACMAVQPTRPAGETGLIATVLPIDVAAETPSAAIEVQPVITITVVTTVTVTPAPITTTIPITTVTMTPPAITGTPLITDTPVYTDTLAPTETPPIGPTVTLTPPAPTSTSTPSLTATASPTPGPPPTQTPLPDKVFVRDHSSRLSGSDLLVVGEVANGAASEVTNVTVSAAFYDAAGNLIGAAESPAILPQTIQTQSNPFKIRLPNAPANLSTYELALRWDDFSVRSYDRITIVSQAVDSDNGVTISGELRNDGFSPASNIVIAATLYDSVGHVLDAIPGKPASTSLAPGEITSYTISAQDAPSFDRILVQAQAVQGR